MENNSLLDSLLKKLSQQDRRQVTAVAAYALQHLSPILRLSGESYATHGLEVAQTFAEMDNDAELISVAILHDLLVHPDQESLLQASPLNDTQQQLVRGMHRLRRLHISTDLEDLDTFIENVSKTPGLIHLRMAHRLNDVRHLKRFDTRLQRKIAQESLHMYSAIAGRLGMHRWRYEMEDICFKRLHPSPAKLLEQQFRNARQIDESSLKQTAAFLQKKCREGGLKVHIESRFKALYSTYRKMLVKNRTFKQLTDRLALRLIVSSLEDCYKALGIVHTHMHPQAGKLKDYIGAPKENGYQSIHTVVYPLPGVTEQPIEIQIRTKEMHQHCEFGNAGHSHYKNMSYSLKHSTTQIDLFKNFHILRINSRSPEQFETALRTYFDQQHLAVFDDNNNLYHIKKPANILDFLCMVYPEKVLYIDKVKRNGRMEHLDAELHEGDVIEAIWHAERKHRHINPKLCKHPESSTHLLSLL